TTNSPTNHSTTMTNPEHAEKALAYDVAVGLCYLTEKQINALRVQADWRMASGISDDDRNKKFAKYFKSGTVDGLPMHKWVHAENSEGNLPGTILDEREGEFYLKAGDLI
ncbi:effector protein Tle3 domain-containing protein, partial [Burkholderia sp. BCC1970]